MSVPSLADLPPAPPGRTGWPWTEASPPIPATMPDGSPWPRISIVTPSFNQGRFLEETIRSVLLQGYPNLEYVVIDGGSTDGSVEIIQRYAPFLAYWVSERDRGQTEALNKGFARTTGAVMAWLNSDDYYVPGALHRVALALAERPWAGLVFGDSDFVDADGRFLRRFPLRRLDRFAVMRGETVIPQQSAFWRRQVWDAVGPLNEEYHYCMDMDFWMSVGERFDVAYVPEVWSKFRLYDESKTGGGEEPFHREERIIIARHARRARVLRLVARQPCRFASPGGVKFLAGRLLPRAITRGIDRLRGYPVREW